MMTLVQPDFFGGSVEKRSAVRRRRRSVLLGNDRVLTWSYGSGTQRAHAEIK